MRNICVCHNFSVILQRETAKTKGIVMATYAININERTVWGRGLVQYLQSIPVNLTLTPPIRHKRKCSLDNALDEVRRGEVETFSSAAEMFKSLGI